MVIAARPTPVEGTDIVPVWGERGSTLTELAAVVALIALLAGLVVSSWPAMFPRVRRDAWRAGLKALQGASDMFYTLWGRWPAGESAGWKPQPGGPVALPLAWEAKGQDDRPFSAYVRSRPSVLTEEVGLVPAGQTLYYGITRNGRVFATIESPPWIESTQVWTLSSEGAIPLARLLASVVAGEPVPGTPPGTQPGDPSDPGAPVPGPGSPGEGDGDGSCDFSLGREHGWPVAELVGVEMRDGKLMLPSAPVLRPGPVLPSSRVAATAAVVDGEAYLLGGVGSPREILHLGADGAWDRLGLALPADLAGAVGGVVGGKIYLVGGSPLPGVGDRVWEFDPRQGSVRPLGCQLPATIEGAAGVAAGETIYVFGGRWNGVLNPGILKVDVARELAQVLDTRLPHPTSEMAAVSCEGRIYVLGGYAQFSGFADRLDSVMVFDPASGQLTDTGIRLPGRVSRLAVAELDGWIYTFGGVAGDYRSAQPLSLVTCFRPGLARLRVLSPATSLQPPRWGAAALALGDRILVCGGQSESRTLRADVSEVTWLSGVPEVMQCLPLSTTDAGFLCGSRGQAYVLGGRAWPSAWDMVWRLEAGGVEYSQVLKLPQAMANAAWAEVEGIMYGAGGITGVSAYDRRLSEIVRVDAGRGVVSSLGNLLPFPVEGMAAAALDQRVYLVGGWNGTASSDQVLRFDPVAGVVSVLPVTMPTGRHQTAAVAHEEGVWLLGGQEGNHLSDEILVLEEEGDQVRIESAGRLPFPVSRAAAVAWRGRIYLLGGVTATGASGKIVEIDPDSGDTRILSIELPGGGPCRALAREDGIYVLTDAGNVLKVVPRPWVRIRLDAGAPRLWRPQDCEVEGEVEFRYRTSCDGEAWSPEEEEMAALPPGRYLEVIVEFVPAPPSPVSVSFFEVEAFSP